MLGSSVRPPAVPVVPGDVPGDLSELRQWICWDWSWKRNRWARPPLSPITCREIAPLCPRSSSENDIGSTLRAAVPETASLERRVLNSDDGQPTSERRNDTVESEPVEQMLVS